MVGWLTRVLVGWRAASDELGFHAVGSYEIDAMRLIIGTDGAGLTLPRPPSEAVGAAFRGLWSLPFGDLAQTQ